MLGEGRLRDWGKHAGSDPRSGRRSLSDDDDNVEAGLPESPADGRADQATADDDDISGRGDPGRAHHGSLI